MLTYSDVNILETCPELTKRKSIIDLRRDLPDWHSECTSSVKLAQPDPKPRPITRVRNVLRARHYIAKKAGMYEAHSTACRAQIHISQHRQLPQRRQAIEMLG